MGKRGPKPGTGGRKKKIIDWDKAAKLAEILCPHTEIAYVLGVHYDTLNNACKRELGITFSEFMDKNRGTGKVKLRQKLNREAQAGNTAVMIFLAKNWLGMSDRQQVEHSGRMSWSELKETAEDE